MPNQFDTIAQQILMAQEIVFFTGAGVSVDSGIPTYRDSGDGLWNSTDPAEVSSIQSFRDKPEWVWQWKRKRGQKAGKGESESVKAGTDHGSIPTDSRGLRALSSPAIKIV